MTFLSSYLLNKHLEPKIRPCHLLPCLVISYCVILFFFVGDFSSASKIPCLTGSQPEVLSNPVSDSSNPTQQTSLSNYCMISTISGNFFFVFFAAFKQINLNKSDIKQIWLHLFDFTFSIKRFPLELLRY